MKDGLRPLSTKGAKLWHEANGPQAYCLGFPKSLDFQVYVPVQFSPLP